MGQNYSSLTFDIFACLSICNKYTCCNIVAYSASKCELYGLNGNGQADITRSIDKQIYK